MNKIEQLIQQLCPDGVEYKELGELGSFYGGLTGKSKNDFQDGNAKFVTYMNIFSNIAVRTDMDIFVKIGVNENQNRVEYGDVLFTGSSETPDECGMSSVLTEKITEPLYLNSFCFGFRLYDKDLFLPDFLKYLFRDDSLRKQIGQTASGVTRFNISKKRFAKVTIPIPPLPIQQEIVNILDKFTQLEAELEAELEARKKQYKFYRNELLNFEGKEVEWKTLGEVIVSLKTGLNPRKNFILNTPDAKNYYVTVRELNGIGITFYDKTDRVNDEGLRLINNRSNLEEGDVLFSGTGTIGRTALVKEKPKSWNVKEGVYIIKPNQKLINSKFLLFYLNSKQAILQIDFKTVGSPVCSIPMADLKKIKFPVLPLAEQERIVGILDKFDALVASTSSATEGLPAEIAARRKQYEYYRSKLLSFEPLTTNH
ncbi:MAG: restriction endonuclease subunit S, partial [Paludibacter sp.]|nr:restriction endonuclease subunit S [Paludibacter sp.]